MKIKKLQKILEKGEGLKIEFKKSSDSVPVSLYETVVSFSNSEGGTIVLGVNDDGIVSGIQPDKVGQLKSDIITALNEPSCIYPPILASPTVCDHSDGKILILNISVSSQVHNHAGKVYIREGEVDIDITQNQTKLSHLYLKKHQTKSETVIYPYLIMDDLDKSLFDKARSIIRGFQSTHHWVVADNDHILRESSLYRKDFQSGEEGLTLAAALIFGKDSTIQNILPHYKIDAMVRINNQDRYDDRLVLRTNLIDSYLQLLEFIKKYLPEKFYIEDGQRKDLRELIFREVVGNLIVHREYTDEHSTEVIIYKDKVETTNPNIPHFSGPIDPNSFNPFPKNPTIRKFFTAFGWTDEIGSGIRNVNKYLKFYVSGTKPLFYENQIFKIEIPLISSTLERFAENFGRWLELPDNTIPHFKEGFQNITLDSADSIITFETLILNLVPSWQQKGTKLEKLDWPKNQVVTETEIKKVPSWGQKGTKLLHKKIIYLISILVLCTKAAKLDEIMNWMNYKNKPTFRRNYLDPLRQVEFIKMTIPDKPQDPNQQYIITEKGKHFLAGRDF